MRRRGADNKAGATAAGFTLVELLVVIGIITVLIAILLPVLARVRQQAYEVKCATNLRTMGQGLLTYVADHKHYPGAEFPWTGRATRRVAMWPVRLRKYVGSGTALYYCPARPSEWAWEKDFGPPGLVVEPPNGGVYANEGEVAVGYELGERLLTGYGRPDWRFSYGYNGGQGRGLGRWPRPGRSSIDDDWYERRASLVRRPAEVIAIADAGYYLIMSSVGNVHRGGANIVFCDGHVQRYRREDVGGLQNAAMWHYDNRP